MINCFQVLVSTWFQLGFNLHPYIQAGAGIVADSDPESEYQETVNKAAALGRAIDLAEEAFDL